MKSIFTCFAFACIALISLRQAGAQSKTLPYKTGWHSASEKDGWTLHQLKSTAYFTWEFGNNLDHDYPVGNSNGDSVEDWMVSPPLKISGKSLLSLSANVYVFGGSRPSDYFGIWYSTKSSDPKSGTFKKLADLTYFSTTKFTNWHDTSDIALDDTGSNVFLALVYKETDNWFTVGADSLEIKEAHTSVIENGPAALAGGNAIYPNPAHGSFIMTIPAALQSLNAKIVLTNIVGQPVSYAEANRQAEIIMDVSKLAPGVYHYRVYCSNGYISNGRLIVE